MGIFAIRPDSAREVIPHVDLYPINQDAIIGRKQFIAAKAGQLAIPGFELANIFTLNKHVRGDYRKVLGETPGQVLLTPQSSRTEYPYAVVNVPVKAYRELDDTYGTFYISAAVHGGELDDDINDDAAFSTLAAAKASFAVAHGSYDLRTAEHIAEMQTSLVFDTEFAHFMQSLV